MSWVARALSNRLRPVTALVALVWLAAIGWDYAVFSSTQHPGFAACVAEPEACAGERIVLPIWKVVEVQADRYVVFKASGPVVVAGPTEGLEVGATVSVEGTFDPERLVVAESHRKVHVLRRHKELLSMGAAVAVAIWLPFGFRLTRRGVVARG